jgi:hypothetical protein
VTRSPRTTKKLGTTPTILIAVGALALVFCCAGTITTSLIGSSHNTADSGTTDDTSGALSSDTPTDSPTVTLPATTPAALPTTPAAPPTTEAPPVDTDPTTQDAAPPADTGLDPRFRTCKEAIAHGYGPYYKGVDREYDWYRDADGDGVDCER